MRTKNTNPAPWIRLVSTLSELENRQLEDRWPLLPIDDVCCFDVVTWRAAEPWTTNKLPPLTGAKRLALSEDMLSRGIDRRPVLVLSDGWVADGNTRLLIYDDFRRDGVEISFPGFEIRSFGDQSSREDFQTACAVMHRQCTTKQRKLLLRDGIRRHADWTDNRLGALYGLTQDTVTKISEEMVLGGQIEARPAVRIGADGRSHPAPRTLPPKNKKEKKTDRDPTLAFVTAWHLARGGHGSTSEQLISLADASGIDLSAIGVTRPEQVGRGRHLAVTKWLNKIAGQKFGSFVVTAFRAESGNAVFCLVREKDFRPDIHDGARELPLRILPANPADDAPATDAVQHPPSDDSDAHIDDQTD